MDYWAAIRQLQIEKERLDKAIGTLEALLQGDVVQPSSRRGRKDMPEDERKKVSERMKRYWASRRNHRSKTEEP
jgi:hypothetical protein